MSIYFNAKFKTKELIGRGFNSLGFQVRRTRRLGALNTPKSSNFDEEAIIADLIEEIDPKEHFYVDIGAGDGESMSNTFPLAAKGWHGLAVECLGDQCAFLA